MHTTSQDKIKLPALLSEYFITYDGKIFLGDKEITFNEFLETSNVEVTSLLVLRLIATRGFNWPPVYWKYLKVLGEDYEYADVENTVLGITQPVESLEYPGFYMIPYFSNYVISRCGKLIKKSTGTECMASLAVTGYYTYRVTDDSNRTGNRLRHRLLAMAFIPYDYDFESRDINHINGIRGSDDISNLEWCTRSENMNHAYDNGLRKDNIEVEIYDMVNNKHYIFRSYSQASEFMGCSDGTIANRAKSNGYKCYQGYQYRDLKNGLPFPSVEMTEGDYEVTLTDNRVIRCTRPIAARYCGVTETSLSRIIREGRNQGNNNNFVRKLSPGVE